MTIYIKRGTDVGAPTLTPVAGSLITLLNYLLVTTMGWTKEFTDTNKAVYRAAVGNRFYLAVDDTNAISASIRGYEAMTGVSTGTGPFPTVAQAANGLMVFKGSTASVNVVGTDWAFFSDGTLFHLLTNGGNPGATGAGAVARLPFTFGDFFSYKAGDTYNVLINGCVANFNTTSAMAPQLALNVNEVAVHAGCYVARPYSQVGSSVQVSKVSNTAGNYSGRIGGGSLTYPAPIDGGLLMSPILIQEGAAGPRGRIPGMWNPLHTRPLSNGDTFSGVDDMVGATFETFDLGYSNGALSGQCFMESSDTWSA